MYINVMKFEATLESCLSILEKAWVTWNEDEKLAEIVDVEYKSLVCEALIERIDRAQLDVERLAEDKSHAKATKDRLLLKTVRRKEQRMLSNLEEFSNELFDINPDAYRARFPGVRLPIRHTLLGSTVNFIKTPLSRTFGRFM